VQNGSEGGPALKTAPAATAREARGVLRAVEFPPSRRTSFPIRAIVAAVISVHPAAPVMPSLRRPRHGPKPDRRRALELLASCRDGCTEAMMLAHGFTVPQTVELVRDGLATASAERVVAGNRTIEVARVRMTAAGRKALMQR
jgi:hypothetical protein